MQSLSGLSPCRPIFSLHAAGPPLRVVRFSGYEALSSLFEFRVEAAGIELDPETLIGQPATLTIDGAEALRRVHGVVSEAEYVGETRQLQLYELTIVPWAHWLLYRSNCRLFQDRTTEQIVTEVLTRAGLKRDWFRFSLVEAYAPRNYCVQYRETDLAFVSRLLEEDGIFYFFEHAEDRHIWVMADHAKAHPPIAGTPAVWFNPPMGSFVQDREHIRSFRFGGRVRSGKVSLRDVDLHKPYQNMEVSAAAKVDEELEVYDFPGEYQDPGHNGPHQGQRMAKIRLQAHQVLRRVGSGESDCPRLTAGHVFQLVGHPRAELNAEYRLMGVNHTGSQPQVLDQDASGESTYHSTFRVTEMKVPFRPPRTTPRPVMRGLQTATVVGPEGEEIHTDEHGRVRVKFHWDRSDAYDETCTCWVRVAQLWAGNGWGSMFIPRIGHEVLVDFLEGDPDRPLVTGRIYHGLNRPPYPLPDEKTKSTIRSESSLGGGGFNELRFEDKKGQEEIFLHAQRDCNTFTINNSTETVGSNRSASIGANETVNVGANRVVNVAASDVTTVGREHRVTISPPPPVVIQFPALPFVPPLPALVLPMPPTTLTMSTQFIELSTGFGTVTIDKGDIAIKTRGKLTIDAGGEISVTAGADLLLNGGPMVKINQPKPSPDQKEKIAQISEEDKQAVQKLIDEGKKQEAVDKASEVLAKAGFDMSVMKNGKPVHDPSDSNFGSTPRVKDAQVTVGDAAFADSPTLLTTIAHERKHAEQWQNPAVASAMGSDARELEAYFEEIRHEDNFGVGAAMRENNREYVRAHYANLSPQSAQKYKGDFDSLLKP